MTLTGNVDGLFERAIHGWAYRPDRPTERVEVVVRADGVEVARTTADLLRNDLAGHGIGDGRYGFEIPCPPGIPKFRLAVQFAETGQSLPGSFADNVSIARRLELPRSENPLMEELIAEDELSDEQADLVRTFARDGFLKFRVTDPQFDELADAAIGGIDWSRSNGIRVQDAWSDVDAVRRLASLPEVMELLKLLYGRPAVPFQTLNFRVGTQQETHSDSIHFSSRPARFMCGVWIALEPVDARNGALHYFPGSHRLPILELNDLGLFGDEARMEENFKIYGEMLQAMIRVNGLHKQVALMDRGEAVIWAANLYHGGDPILDPARTRYSQVTHYYFEGCAYYAPLSSDPYLDRYVRPDRCDVRTGTPIRHWFGTHPVGESGGEAPKAKTWLGRLLGG